MAAKKPQIRLNNDIKKAVHSGNGYEDYMTVYQFLKCKLDMLTRALRRTAGRCSRKMIERSMLPSPEWISASSTTVKGM